MDYAYKIIPYAYWQVEEYEQWLVNQARDGWEVVKVGPIWAKFKRIQPGERNYKIRFAKIENNNLSSNTGEGDWQEIKAFKNFNLYMWAKNKELEDFEYNQEEELKEIEKLKSASNAQSIMLGICVAVTFIILSAYLTETNFLYKLITGDYISFINLGIMQVIILIQSLLEYRGLKKLQRKFEDRGYCANKLQNQRVRKSNTINIIYTFSTAALFFISLVLLFTGEYNSKTLPEEDIDIPIIRLASLEINPTFQRYESQFSLDSKVDLMNNYEKNWNLLIDIQYKATENGEVRSVIQKEDSPSLDQEIYKFRFKWLGDWFIKGLMKRYDYRTDDSNWEMTKGGSDVIYINENSNSNRVELILHKDAYVIYVYYIGNAGKPRLIEETRKIIERMDI